MTSVLKRALVAGMGFVLLGSGISLARDLTFEDRVRAQEAIERVYYSHQIGATKPFEEAVPRATLEQKVRTYLEESVALDRFWKAPVTAAMLETEAERIARGTRFAERIHELIAALNGDPFMVKECLVRPVLVDRLVRSYHARDRRIHQAAREEAEALRNDLIGGSVDPRSELPGRTLLGVVLRTESSPRLAEAAWPTVERPSPREAPVEVDAAEFQAWRKRLPDRVGGVGPVVEEPQSFAISVLLESSDAEMQAAVFRVPKRSREDWWDEISGGIDPDLAHAVASEAVSRRLIEPAEDGTSRKFDASSLATSAGLYTGGDTWDSNSSVYMIDGRGGHTAVWTGSLMLVWGGESGLRGILASGARYDPAIDQWTPISSFYAPEARTDHSAVWTGDRMIVWGGRGASGHLSSGYQYDPVSDQWDRMRDIDAPDPRGGHTAVWTGSCMLVWGGEGDDPNQHFLKTGGCYDPIFNSWGAISTEGAPPARVNHTAVWTGSEMMVWGGIGGDVSPQNELLDSGGRYDPLHDRWTAIPVQGAPSARYHHTAAWTGTQMVVWGGWGGDTPPTNVLSTGGRYDPVTDAWSPTTAEGAPSARQDPTAVWTGTRMIVWGGETFQQGQAAGGSYDPATDSWVPLSLLNAPDTRHGNSALWTGHSMIVWGGSSDWETGGRYDPGTDTWTPTSDGDGPSSRVGHTAVWTGDLMLVWGGAALDPGWRYDPTLDSWSPISSIDRPLGYESHSAIWTGHLMVVWGGWTGRVESNQGRRYDPISDRWTGTSIKGAPSPREQHTAVWTGKLMIVWGGVNGPHPETGGGRYDPSHDRWRPMAKQGAPTARAGHTAVWTGKRMIVWGGFDAQGYELDGGIYNPSKNHWLIFSNYDAPEPRAGHVAVWTGTEMLVWGGQKSLSEFLDTGGRFDPVRVKWKPMTTVNAPTHRWGHTAVWTGKLMMVWGGTRSEGTGGLYDPATDQWTPTSLYNAPLGRILNTAVWTGTSVIVWGGHGLGADYLTRSGGRYVPPSTSP